MSRVPHFLVHGASAHDGSDTTQVVFACDEQTAQSVANDAGVFVGRIEPLDADETTPADYGQSSALSRLATKLSRAGRTDDAIAVMKQVYAMNAEFGGHSLCLRIPRYLLKAGRRDEAWASLMQIKTNQVVGNGLHTKEGRLPSDFEGFYYMHQKVLLADGRKDQAKLYEAAGDIAYLINEFQAGTDDPPIQDCICSRTEAVRQIAEIASKVLPHSKSAEDWTNTFLGPSEKLSYKEATKLASTVYAALIGH